MNKIKNGGKGFTLLELLVVVLIIGILAAIALPQYQVVVGKAKFSTLKNLTRSIWDSAQRYYLANNTYPQTTADLDIGLNIKKETYSSTSKILQFTTNEQISCNIWNGSPNLFASCSREIAGKKMSFYIKANGSPLSCIVFSTEENSNDTANKICQSETGKPPATEHTEGSYYLYYY